MDEQLTRRINRIILEFKAIYFAKGLEFDTGINRIILEFKDYLII